MGCSHKSCTVYGARVEALGSAAVAHAQLTDAGRGVQVAADQEGIEDWATMAVAARGEAEAECRPVKVARAQQESRGTAAEGPVVEPVGVADGQQEGGLGPAVWGVQQSGGLLPPLLTGRTAEIGEEFAVARTERKRKYASWRKDVEHELVRLEGVIRKVIDEAPHDSMTRKKARYELKALDRVREDEANVVARDGRGTYAGNVQGCTGGS